MTRAARSTLALAVVCLSACDTAVLPEPDETLDGRLSAYSQTGESVNLGDVTLAVRNARNETRVLPVRGNGTWAGSDLGPGPYVVTAQADGFVGLAVANVSAGTSGVLALLVERSTVQVLRVEEAVLEGADVCGNPHCLFLRFTVAEAGSFPHDSRTQWFRLFIGDSGAVTPEQYRQSRFLIVADDGPGLERGEAELTIHLDCLRGFDWESMNLDKLSIYLVGATENQVGLRGPEIEERGWPDLAATGIGVSVTR